MSVNLNRVLSNGQSLGDFIKYKRQQYDQAPVVYPVINRHQWLDIIYECKSDKQKLNIYTPMGDDLYPVIFLVHGGGWYTGDRSDCWLKYAFPFIEHGYAIVSIGYRLADEAIFPEPVNDILCGISFIIENGHKYNLKLKCFGIMGGSAGGNIAAHAAFMCNDIIAAQINCAPLDFSTISIQLSNLGVKRDSSDLPEIDTSYEALYLGGDIYKKNIACIKANPVNNRKNNPYFLLIHGDKDYSVPYQQSFEFAKIINSTANNCNKANVIIIPNGNHDSPVTEFNAKLKFFNHYLQNT